MPVGNSASASGTNWSGSCKFTRPGTYTFYCTVHGPAMSGTITVGAPSTSPTGTTTTATTGTTPVYTQPGSTATGTSPSPSGAPDATGQLAPPPAAALTGLRLAALRHGADVRVSVVVPVADAGATLLGTVVATIAGRPVAAGRAVRAHTAPGTASLTIPLSAAARRALRSRRRLAVTVHVTLRPAAGTPSTLTRRLTLRAAS